jgi:hypothetical protein
LTAVAGVGAPIGMVCAHSTSPWFYFCMETTCL